MRWYREEYRSGIAKQHIDEHVNPSVIYEGYSSRQCIFDPEIDIEDTYGALIKYDQGAILNYSLNGSVPYEGFRLGINGTEGRIEFKELHAKNRLPYSTQEVDEPVVYIPMFGGRERIDAINLGGGHGGGDPLMRDELFIGENKLGSVCHKAGLEESIEVVLTGIAMYKSVLEHKMISVDDLCKKVFLQHLSTDKVSQLMADKSSLIHCR